MIDAAAASPSTSAPGNVLLLHGLTGSPSELRPLGAGLAAVGWRPTLPTWPGHASRPEDLARTSAEDLLEAAHTFAAEPFDAVVGLSMGALLALVVAASSRTVRRVVLLAPAIQLTGAGRLLEVLARLPAFPRGISFRKPAAFEHRPLSLAGLGPAGRAARAAPVGSEGRYDAIPLVWGARLPVIRDAARRAVAGVQVPVLVVHGLADATASPDGATTLTSSFSGGNARLVFVGGAGHQLAAGPARSAVADLAADFLAPVAASVAAKSA